MNVKSLFRRRSRTPGDVSVSAAMSTGSVSEQLIATGRCARLLNRHFEHERDAHAHALAWLSLEKDMGLVPGFQPHGEPVDSGASTNRGAPFYVDRTTVTNAQYAHFVADGGYSATELWPEALWPNLLQFVDQTGMSGPRFWSDGRFPRGRDRHPVVGICWYEAQAFAMWMGKRLPESEEWQHAASWCTTQDGTGGQCRYPWGNTFEPTRANTWHAGPGDTVSVDEYPSGGTPNGLYQLIGNVWEWMATPYRCGSAQDDVQILFAQPMAEIRGGAFDTYFESQATAFFRTGQPLLYRGLNVGFRCAVSFEDLVEPDDPTAYLQA